MFGFSTRLKDYVTGKVRFIISIPVFLLAFYLIREAGYTLFVGSDHSSGLITVGILSHVRVPLYLGSLMFYLGCLASYFSLIAFFIYVGVCLVHNKLANYEENDLIRIYGDEYIEYKNKVPKWVPLIRKVR